MKGRERTFGVVAAGIIPAVLYLCFVFHYSVNVPYADDWLMVPLSLSALHGHLNMTELWRQFDDTRLFIPSLLVVLFSFIDHLNEKSVIMFAALLFVASYGMLLLLFRSYLAKSISAVSVLIIGIVWFSLADVQNALWSFQLAWYLATFFFVVMAYCLVAPHQHGGAFMGLAIVAAVAGSYSIDQGFILWPIGLVCIFWKSSWGRRTGLEAAVWIACAVITTAIYLIGYRFVNVACPHTASCSTSFGLTHPTLLARYFALLVGNVVPTSNFDHSSLLVHELLGVVIVIAAAFVAVQVIRERRNEMSPLPLLLIAFGILFDLMIAVGRVGQGLTGALSGRYTMPNLILLVGIVIYVGAHHHVPWRQPAAINWSTLLTWVGVAAFAGFLVVQCVVSLRYGIANARTTHQTYETDARVVVNLHRIPIADQGCEISVAVFPLISPSLKNVYTFTLLRNDMAREHLSVFQPNSERRYAAEGPPPAASFVKTAGNLPVSCF